MPYFPPEDDTQPTGIQRAWFDDTASDTRPLTPVPIRRRRAWWVLPGALMIGGAAALIAGAFILFVLQGQPTPAITVQLQIEGRTYSVTSSAATVGDLLREQEVQLSEYSVVTPDATTALTPGMMIVISVERSVTVTIDGETSIFRTIYDHPLDILESIRFFPDADDEVRVNGTKIDFEVLGDYPLPANEIIVNNAVTLTIQVDDELRELETTATTVGDVLHEAGITLFLGDVVTPAVETPVKAGLQIIVERSLPVTILVDGVSIETRSGGVTVGDALQDAGISLNGLDYAIPPESIRLTPEMQVRVVRVTEEVITEQTEIPYEAIYQADAELELDQQRTIQAGVTGIQQHNIRVRYEDGVEVSRLDEGVNITQEPVNQIISYGTKVVVQTIDTPDGPREYWRKLRLYATSYHPEALGGDNVTATGKILTKGIVAIDPKLIPYGTQMFVPNYGIGEAADTGGPRRSRYWIDLGYDDANFVSWSRWVDVYLLTPVPANIPYILPAQ